ncbi:signal recognition particle receptor protein FtsY (alpha subunit) [Candidatus Kuenenia stuttgartiensis]|uniref:Signal recognition particle receptor FtsY n=1 Tax=Kuenenia stuttgartiensis TaxID=174633 RepID=A0A6G7GJ00_KUEST|nr:signal recognition particle-docking protein FtsY [Candidatus Kuenenia stuttgartiensis]QII09558.1 signal recognition particle receptor protein FtsY (alpha subunit) [Candidatus Kuenenia stuttgartiensis]
MGKTQKTEVKNGIQKTKKSLWYRIINYTVEPRKKVVIEEEGTIRLVPFDQVPVLAEKAVVEKHVPAETAVVEKAPPVKPVFAPPEMSVLEKAPPEELVVPEEIPVVEEIKEKPVIKKEPVAVPGKLKKGLEKTRGRFWLRLKDFLSFRQGIDESALEELKDILIGADIGVRPVQKLIEEIREAWKEKAITETSQINDFIKDRLKDGLHSWQTDIQYADKRPTVIMVVGVNGVGKTTSIAKLASFLMKEGKKVMLAAGDTFRAAAVDQLDIWCKRIGADIVKHQTGSDPAAVAYDAMEASIARGVDVLIVDTAGRLHTHDNLMKELIKIKRVIKKKIPDAPHEVLLVLDATTGQNAISQARMFREAVDVTGIFLAKLDGTAKGGIVLGMCNETEIPVKFIGLGEQADDIERFNPDLFVETLLEQ